MSEHCQFTEKYNPSNFKPEIYNFLENFEDYELAVALEIFKVDNQAAFEQSTQKITQIINQKYTYKKRKKSNLSLDPETLGGSGQLDCYGYSIALSQMLSLLNIAHKIAFANTHAFVLANNSNISDDYFLLDPISPEISGKIDPGNICHTNCIEENIFSINMLRHINELPADIDKIEFLRDHPWTNFSKNQNRIDICNRDDLIPTANSNIYIRSFNPSEGIQCLYAFDQYKVAIERKKLSNGYFLSKVISKNYPEVDIRNRPKPAEELISSLGRLGLTKLASDTIDRTAEGRQVAQTIAPQIWRADQYRKLSQLTGYNGYLKQSEFILNELLLKPNLTSQQIALLKGKLTKLSKLIM